MRVNDHIDKGIQAIEQLRNSPAVALLREQGWSYKPTNMSPVELFRPFSYTDGWLGGHGVSRTGFFSCLEAAKGNYEAFGTSAEEVKELTRPLYRRGVEIAVRNYERQDEGWEDRVLFDWPLDPSGGNVMDGEHFIIPSLTAMLARQGGAEELRIEPERANAAVSAAIEAQFVKTVQLIQIQSTTALWDPELITGDPQDPNRMTASLVHTGSFVPLAKLVQLVDGDYARVPDKFKAIVNPENVAHYITQAEENEKIVKLQKEIEFWEKVAVTFHRDINIYYGGDREKFESEAVEDGILMDEPPHGIVVVTRSALIGRAYVDMRDFEKVRDPGIADGIRELGGYAKLESYIPDIHARMEALEAVAYSFDTEWQYGTPAPALKEDPLLQPLDQAGENPVSPKQPSKKSAPRNEGDTNTPSGP